MAPSSPPRSPPLCKYIMLYSHFPSTSFHLILYRANKVSTYIYSTNLLVSTYNANYSYISFEFLFLVVLVFQRWLHVLYFCFYIYFNYSTVSYSCVQVCSYLLGNFHFIKSVLFGFLFAVNFECFSFCFYSHFWSSH